MNTRRTALIQRLRDHGYREISCVEDIKNALGEGGPRDTWRYRTFVGNGGKSSLIVVDRSDELGDCQFLETYVQLSPAGSEQLVPLV